MLVGAPHKQKTREGIMISFKWLYLWTSMTAVGLTTSKHENILSSGNIVRSNELPLTDARAASAVIHLDAAVGNVSQFWKSTGFCPPSPHTAAWRWFSSESMIQNLLYIGALPFDAIEQVRIHWMLDLITVSGGLYNFTQLDLLLDRLRDSGLRPGFELMGNPSGVFTDLEDRRQVLLWRDLVTSVARRYIGRYGLSYVRRWNFETWNEPKARHFDKLNMTVKGFLNYYDACAAGLRLAGGGLRFGGPGGECKKFKKARYCWALLDHIHNGRDFFTGLRSYVPDYISIHKKGEEPNNTDWVLKKEEMTISDISSHFPNLTHVPIFNDEADPLVGWSRSKWWRADATYAAMITKIIVQHHRKWFEEHSKVTFGLLSNDNGFLSYQPEVFTQRTLLARFQLNDTATPGVQMVAKPAFSVMGLLALLGRQQQKVVVTGLSPAVGILATRENKGSKNLHLRIKKGGNAACMASFSDEWSVLIYNSNDTYNSTTTAGVTLSFTGPQVHANTLVTAYQIDNFHGNPYRVWVNLGSPPEPSRDQFARMRKEEGLTRILNPKAFRVSDKLHVQLPQPGVCLVQICARPDRPPHQVKPPRVHRISAEQVLVTWSDSSIKTRCLLTYIIQFSLSGQKHTYKRLNGGQIIFNYFVVDRNIIPGPGQSLRGFYRVRAVDLWQRKGPPSAPFNFT